MNLPRLFADFQNADVQGRVRLNCQGTVEELAKLGVTLTNGLAIELYGDDGDSEGNPHELRVQAVAEFSSEEQIWVARIDWNKIGSYPASLGEAPRVLPTGGLLPIGQAPSPASP